MIIVTITAILYVLIITLSDATTTAIAILTIVATIVYIAGNVAVASVTAVAVAVGAVFAGPFRVFLT